MMTLRLSTLVAVLTATVALAANASAAPHGILWAKGAKPVTPAVSGGLQYYGGPVISHPKVYAVFWGDSVDPETVSKIGPFFENMLDSTYMDMFRQYKTDIAAVDGRQGTNQTLNRGAYAGGIAIAPNNASTSLSDADIQHELDAQIAAGKLPAPSADSLYMIYFPAGISIAMDNIRSCQQFCAYHEGFNSAKTGTPIFYGVMPVCGFGCGVAGSTFDSLTVVSSHECSEAVTDPFPTPGDKPAYPQAWNDAGGQEVGDLCAQGNATVTGHGLTSAVQWEYDNSIGGCNQGPWSQNGAPSFSAASLVPRSTRPAPVLDAVRASPAAVFAGR
ncbi:MAG: hypothetical protein ACHQ49_09535 [Elusimicrobiota bacterium]